MMKYKVVVQINGKTRGYDLNNIDSKEVDIIEKHKKRKNIKNILKECIIKTNLCAKKIN